MISRNTLVALQMPSHSSEKDGSYVTKEELTQKALSGSLASSEEGDWMTKQIDKMVSKHSGRLDASVSVVMQRLYHQPPSAPSSLSKSDFYVTLQNATNSRLDESDTKEEQLISSSDDSSSDDSDDSIAELQDIIEVFPERLSHFILLTSLRRGGQTMYPSVLSQETTSRSAKAAFARFIAPHGEDPQ